MYKESITIQYSDLAPGGKASLSAILEFFQNIAINHSSASGFTLDYLYERSRAWILISMSCEVLRYPENGERVEVLTYTTGFERVYGKRCFKLLDSGGNELARAASLWVFLDTKTGRPSRVFEEIMEAYGVEGDAPFEYMHREPPVQEGEEVGQIVVGKRDIDTNHHVNNVKLAQFLLEALPIDAQVRQAHIFYRASSYEKDVLRLNRCEENGEIGVRLVDSEGKSRTTAKIVYF